MSPALRRSLHVSLASLVLSLASTGCLEANATLPAPDGGAETSTSPGHDSGMVTTHPDATSPGDATVDGGGTGDGSVTRPDAGAEAAADAAATIPSCKDPNAQQLACASCVESSCAGDVGPAVSACADFYTCFEACSCSDASCISACESMATGACTSPAEALVGCQNTMCASACAADAGTTPVDAAPPGDAGATCKNPTATQEACGECEESKCMSTVTAENSDCVSFNQCFDACDCSDTSCIDACAEKASSPCQTDLESLETCETGACQAACSGSDAGASAKDGGSSGTIPDCKSPTSTEQSTYTMCSACDVEFCASYESAAVAACGTYYQCFAMTDCSDTAALTTCYDDDALTNTTCLDAIDELATCQNSFCYAPCAGF